MSTTRDSFHHKDLANAALHTALTFIEANGVQNLTWRGLAEQVGVNHRALYRHFTDREDVILKIANLGFEQLTAECVAAIIDLDPPLSFRALMAAYVDFAFARPKLYELMFSIPLKEEFEVASELSLSLKHLINISLKTCQQSKDIANDINNDIRNVARDRVVASIGQAHGLILLFQAGVFKSKSQSAAKKYICGLIEKSPLVST